MSARRLVLVAVLTVAGAVSIAIAAAYAIGAVLPVAHVAAVRGELPATRERVWQTITDWQGQAQWRTEVAAVEVRSVEGDDVVWVEVDTWGDSLRLATVEMDPPRKLVTMIADDEAPFAGTWTFELDDDGEGTYIRIVEEGEVYDPLFRLCRGRLHRAHRHLGGLPLRFETPPGGATLMARSRRERVRCDWVKGADDLYVAYHDDEWGIPVHDEKLWFEFLVLEGAQAGLSWSTVLKKRENYRRALDGFDAAKVARYDKRKIERLLKDEGIIRNRLKVEGTVKNARAFLEVQRQHGSFDAYIWEFVDGAPIQNHWRKMSDVPALTPLAESISKALKKRGFTFVGPTICYALMQATGMVNDHTTDCYRHTQVAAGH